MFRRYQTTSEVPIIGMDELKERIEKKSDDYVLIDVREPQEVANTSLIETAINIPMNDIFNGALLLDEEQWEDRYGSPRPDFEGKELIFYCKAGQRSYYAATAAKQQGFERVKNYQGSAYEWFQGVYF